MMFWIYWSIVLMVSVGILHELWSDRDWREHATAAMVLIPLLLRLFLVK